MGKTIIMVTHEDEVSVHAKRVIRLRDGLVQSDVLNGAGRVTFNTSGTPVDMFAKVVPNTAPAKTTGTRT